MANSTKQALLALVLLLVATLESQLERVQCSVVRGAETEASSCLEAEAGDSPRHGVGESKVVPETWRTSQSRSQEQTLRLFRDRKRAQIGSVETGAKHGARWANLEEVELDEETQLPLQQLNDLVTKLPGQPPVNFSQYAGYVTVDKPAGRALFYYFVEATSSPETKPLVLWLNGGPGSSSIGYGAFKELGPFRVNSDGKTLYSNYYAWNKLANVLFVESPAGVGFSYSNTSSDYTSSGDNRTASDSLTFLLNWFQRFPQYKHRDFYITGESYAGHFVPQLTQTLVHYNQGIESPFINLKGFMVGNPVIDHTEDKRGMVDYMWTHALISDETYAKLVPCMYSESQNCIDIRNEAYAEQGNIDRYDIYTPTCLLNLKGSSRPASRKFGRFKGYDPCVDNYVNAYLNRPDVQQALHANVTKVSFPWVRHSDTLSDGWQDKASSIIPIYKELISVGLKIWVYSGDVDSGFPVTSTKYSLGLLKLKTTVPWYAWYRDGQVGGYTQGYDGLTFATVRNAGHEVPLYQPARAFSIITSYLSGEPLPKY